MKVFRIVMSLMLLGLILNSCSKYEDGPGFSLYSKGKRVNGTWFFSNVRYNEQDSIEEYRNSAIEFLLGDVAGKDSGSFTWNMELYSSTFDPTKLQRGFWNFYSEKDSFQMVIVAFDPINDDTIKWEIDRLAFDEWWMHRQYDDTTILVWRLWKRVY